MLIAALTLAFVAFLALVAYIMTAHTAALVLLFLSSGAGLIIFFIDCQRKWTNRKK